MKNTTRALSLFLAFFVSSVQVVSLSSANPIWATFLPEFPDKNPPIVNVSSPINNQEYDADSVTLNVTVIEPDSWFRTNEYGNTKIVEVSSVRCSVDLAENQTVYVGSIDLDPAANHPWNHSEKHFSLTLTGLTEGSHAVAVYAEAVTAYLPDPDEPFKLSNATVSSPPQIVTFMVTPTIVPTHNDGLFQVILTAAVIGTLLVVAVEVLFYRMKRKREARPS